MQSAIPLTQDQLTRQEMLRVWLRRNGKTGGQLGVHAGVTHITACRWLRAESLPTWRVEQMRAFGIPAELLPRAEDVAPGPRKHGQQSETPAQVDA